MKKKYSISLDEELVKILDEYCLKSGISRSDAISDWIINELNNGINPLDEIENVMRERRVMLLSRIYALFNDSSDVVEFIKQFDLDIKRDDDLCLSFESSNRKFYCEIKIINDDIKLMARLESSSRKVQDLFDGAYNKHKDILEEQGFVQNTYQRFWSLEYRHRIGEFSESEIPVIAKYIFKKFLVLYTNFLIELSFVANKQSVSEILEQTASLRNYEKETESVKPPYLKVIVGAMAGKRYRLDDRSSLIIGRGNVNIDLTEQEYNKQKPVVSKRHAEIVRNNDGIYIRDLNSTNGTLLNGRRLEPLTMYRLAEGDRILLSNIEFMLKLY